MDDRNENIGITGRSTSIVLEPDGNIKSEEKGNNTIQSDFKQHLARIIRDENGSGSEYNSSALKVTGKVVTQRLSEDLGGDSNEGFGSEVVSIRFKTSTNKYGIGSSANDVVFDNANKKFTVTSKITGTPDSTTWNEADLFIMSGFTHTGAGSLITPTLHIANASVTGNVDQYDTFVITWVITLQDG